MPGQDERATHAAIEAAFEDHWEHAPIAFEEWSRRLIERDDFDPSFWFLASYGDQVVGNRTKIKVVKNKVAAPLREVEVDILYGQGISREGDLLDLAATHEVVEKSGSWFSYAGERLGQGRDNARLFLKEHTDIRDRLDTAVRQKLGLTEAPPVKPALPETPASVKSQTA